MNFMLSSDQLPAVSKRTGQIGESTFLQPDNWLLATVSIISFSQAKKKPRKGAFRRMAQNY
jgi:hypothetical protein